MTINQGGGGHPMMGAGQQQNQQQNQQQGQQRPSGIQNPAPRGAPPQGQQGGPQGARRQSDTSWTHQGQEAASKSQQLVDQAEQRKAEARERGFFPGRFRLKASPGNSGTDHIGRIIILDQHPGPRYWEHALRNPQTGWEDNFEPCNKEFGSCPICPPDGSKDSYFIMLMTVLHIEGYWSKKHNMQVYGARNLLAVKQGQHSFFDRLHQQWGSLRGLEIQMIRDGNRSPTIGNPDAATPIQQHSEDAIIQYLTGLNRMGPKLDRDGKQVEPAGYYAQPFNYGTFLHKPDGERLRRLYGGSAPVGAGDYMNDDSQQWGNTNPGSTAPPPSGYQGQNDYGNQGGGQYQGSQGNQNPPQGGTQDPNNAGVQGRPRPRPGQDQQQNQSGEDGWANSTAGARPYNGQPPNTDLDDEIPF